MHAIKTPSFFRPISRPSSPQAPATHFDSGVGSERMSRPLNRLTFTSFRKASPAPALSAVPAPVTLVQDGSYLEMLGLKLSEAVSRALAQPAGPATPGDQQGARRPIPAGRGYALGALIASELTATRDNAHLHRAIIRSLHRPLSVLTSNLSAHLLPLLSSAAFHSPSAPSPQYPYPNPTQLCALSLAAFAGELLECFDDLGLGLDNDVRGDGLRVIREALASTVTRVVTPLVTGIKNELLPLIEALEHPNVINNGVKAGSNAKQVAIQHPSIVTLHCVMPVYAKALCKYTTSRASQSLLATFLISVVWRGLVALSHRTLVSRPPSPLLAAGISRSGSSQGSPPVTPPAGRFAIKLPPSRPPSPPSLQLSSSISADARSLYELLNMLPRPAGDQSSCRLAREAVDEAFDGLKALAPLLEAVQSLPSLQGEKRGYESGKDLEALTADIPTLVCLPVLLQAYGKSGENSGAAYSVPSILGLSEDEYRKGCLPGFGRAEECAIAVTQHVLDALQDDPTVPPAIVKWMDAELVLLAEDH